MEPHLGLMWGRRTGPFVEAVMGMGKDVRSKRRIRPILILSLDYKLGRRKEKAGN